MTDVVPPAASFIFDRRSYLSYCGRDVGGATRGGFVFDRRGFLLYCKTNCATSSGFVFDRRGNLVYCRARCATSSAYCVVAGLTVCDLQRLCL